MAQAEKAPNPNSPKQHSGSNQSALKVFSAMVDRMKLAMRANLPFSGKRDLWASFGYPEGLSFVDTMRMYNRGGIARRVAHAYPNAVWSRPPVLWCKEDPAWSQEFEQFMANSGAWIALFRLDILSSLGTYGVLLLGTNKSNLRSELKAPANLVFLQAYSEQNAQIIQWDTQETSPNFGRPSMYRLNPENDSRQHFSSSIGSMPLRKPLEVHWTRTLHVCHGALENDIYGRPVFSDIWNYLVDLEKVVGSSAESYWMTANRGMHADVDKEMAMDSQDAADLSDEIDEYQHGLRRFIRTRGVKVNSLGSEVADPRGPYEVLLTLISGTKGIPRRTLTGSEAGQLASAQDKGNWAERVGEYRQLHAEPAILKPFVERMIAIGAIRKPRGDLKAYWPDAYQMSPLERGQTSAQTARTVANIVKMLESEKEEVRTLLSKDEIRAIIGISTENRVLSEDPQV